jgi:hypothetical protein
MAFAIKVNGNTYDVDVDGDGDTPLLWVLRDVLGMTGSGMSECGTSAIVPAIANAIVPQPVSLRKMPVDATVLCLARGCGRRADRASARRRSCAPERLPVCAPALELGSIDQTIKPAVERIDARLVPRISRAHRQAARRGSAHLGAVTHSGNVQWPLEEPEPG